MSDDEVIEQFIGEFESNGVWQNPDPSLDSWFPPQGIRLIVSKVRRGDVSMAKIRIVLRGRVFPLRTLMEQAFYHVNGTELVADKLQFRPGLTATERLRMEDTATGRVMVHTIRFSNGIEATWICPMVVAALQAVVAPPLASTQDL